jgi:hypothetical protein
MRHDDDLLGRMRAEWVRLGRGAASRAALELVRAGAPEVVPRDARDLGDLVAALEPDGGLTQLERARVIEVLLVFAADPLVRRCLLQTLLPGIVSVARRLRFGDGVADDPGTFLADAVAETAGLLADWAGERRAFAGPDLLAALRCRLRRRLLADKARRSELRQPPERPAAVDAHGVGTLAHDLALAASSQGSDVALLYARCVLGVPAGELASATGVSTGTLRRRLVTAAGDFLATRS